MADEVPNSQVCGFQLPKEKLPEATEPLTCTRQRWDTRAHCILHEPESKKPVDKLQELLSGAENRIDGLHLDCLTIGDSIDFRGMILYGSKFENVDATQADFRGSDLYKADFSESTLRSVRFDDSDTNLERTLFKNTNCTDARFQKATLHHADFSDSNLNSAKFQHSDAAEALFHNTSLKQAIFIHTNLRSAEFVDSELYNAKCDASVLEGATLHGSDIRGGSFIESDLYKVDFRSVVADNNTNFGTRLVREFLSDRDSEPELLKSRWGAGLQYTPSQGPNPESSNGDDFQQEYDPKIHQYYCGLKRPQKVILALSRMATRASRREEDSRLVEAEDIYRDIRQIFQSNPVAEERRKFNIREKECKRKIAYSNRKFEWIRWSFLRRTMLYGESASKVIRTAILAVVGFGALYPIWGLNDNGEIIRYSLSGEMSLETIWTIIFFSLRRLLTATNGDVVPLGAGEALGLLETASGAIIIAMLVFVLGRRATS